MKLFSPKEVKKADLKDGVRESIYLNKRLKAEQDEWNNRKLTLDPEKQRLEREFLSFSKNIQDKRSSLLKEVSDLESRKEKALESLDTKWYDLEVRGVELEQQAQVVQAKEREVRAAKEELVEQLMLTDDKLFDVKNRELALISKETALKQQQDFQAESQNALNAKWQEFWISSGQVQTDLLEQNKQLTAKTESIKAREDLLVQEREELDTLRRQLNDRQQTLERAWNELRTKQHGQINT